MRTKNPSPYFLFIIYIHFRSKKAEQIKKNEQRQAAAQKQELVNKQMANYMGRFFKPKEKPTQVMND